MRRTLILPLLLALLAIPPLGAASAEPASDDPVEGIADAVERFATSLPGVATGPLVTPGRESEPVVLTGEAFPTWAALGDITAKLPDAGGPECQGLGSSCSHSTYEDPDASSAELLGGEGVPVDRLVAYRFDGEGYNQIPFQVDEVFTRYLSNDASGFSFYSMVDQHTSYAFEREGFRWTDHAVDDACRAVPSSEVATDPVPGLDHLDELVSMARDAGERAPADALLPAGIAEAYEVAVVDPYRPDAPGFVYIALAEEDGPRPAFDASNGYVRYARDADADTFLYSQSSYSDYGNAPHGPWFDPATGTCHTAEDEWRQRRPGDQATVTTPRYRFRYEGRWLMTELQISPDADGDWTYGADIVDRWKARAFQQRPGGETPCCGYEEEENNWGGSSILMGELSGPVRTIRETWGADSGTNVVRRETFYRDEIQQKTYLRVHPIPPIDGIYAQWDHNAGAVETYYNPHVPEGVAIDGRNDEVFGNTYLHVSAEGVLVDGDDSLSDLARDLNDGTPLTLGDPQPGRCSNCVSNDVDTADPLFSGPNALLAWEQIAGSQGTLVTRWQAEDVTPGGAAHLPFALPYYRDDACFDDGTGANPGPHLNPRRVDDGEFAYWTDEGTVRERECWDIDQHSSDPAYAADLGTARFTQGSIGTHGMHLLLIADSDNAFTTLPLTEINAVNRMVVLPPTLHNVGETYGRGFEKPLVATAAPFTAETADEEEPDAGPGPPDHAGGPPERLPGPPTSGSTEAPVGTLPVVELPVEVPALDLGVGVPPLPGQDLAAALVQAVPPLPLHLAHELRSTTVASMQTASPPQGTTAAPSGEAERVAFRIVHPVGTAAPAPAAPPDEVGPPRRGEEPPVTPHQVASQRPEAGLAGQMVLAMAAMGGGGLAALVLLLMLLLAVTRMRQGVPHDDEARPSGP